MKGTTFQVTASTTAPSTRMVKGMPTTTTTTMPWTSQRRLLRRLRCSRSGLLFCAFHSLIYPSTHSLTYSLSALAHSLTTRSRTLPVHSLTHPFTHLLRSFAVPCPSTFAHFLNHSLSQYTRWRPPSTTSHISRTHVCCLCSFKCAHSSVLTQVCGSVLHSFDHAWVLIFMLYFSRLLSFLLGPGH